MRAFLSTKAKAVLAAAVVIPAYRQHRASRAV